MRSTPGRRHLVFFIVHMFQAHRFLFNFEQNMATYNHFQSL